MRRVIAACGGLAALALLWGLRGGGTAPTSAQAPPGAGAEVADRPAALDAAEPDAEAQPPLPRSLRGTEIDGAYSLDADGRLLPSPSLLRRFDYYLSASGEEPLAVTIARLHADIDRELSGGAAADARELLDRYLAYREGARTLHAEGLGAADLETRLQRIRELRREHFGAETTRLLFGEEETLALDAIERRRILEDPNLDAAARASRLEDLDARLPEAVARLRARTTLPTRLSLEEAALIEAGGDTADVRRLRETRVGVEAADRLDALDARRRDWRRRLDVYRAERDALLADPDRQPADLEALRVEHFAPEELARVRGLDRSDGVGAPATSATTR